MVCPIEKITLLICMWASIKNRSSDQPQTKGWWPYLESEPGTTLTVLVTKPSVLSNMPSALSTKPPLHIITENETLWHNNSSDIYVSVAMLTMTYDLWPMT